MFRLISIVGLIAMLMSGGKAIASEDLQCYFRTDLTNFNFGVGYFKGDGGIFCDDGSSVKAEFSGWNVLSVGISHADHFDGSYVLFTGTKRIEDLDGRYHGGGFQLSVPLILNFDGSIYTDGETTLQWVSPPMGLAVGLPYKTIEVRFLEEISRPSLKYQTALKTLGNLELVFGEKEVFGAIYKGLYFRFPPNEFLEDVPMPIAYLLEEDGFLWDSDLESGYHWKDGTRDYRLYYIRDISQLEREETYYFTVVYKEEAPVVAYRYEFVFPTNIKPGDVIPAIVERVRELDPF